MTTPLIQIETTCVYTCTRLMLHASAASRVQRVCCRQCPNVLKKLRHRFVTANVEAHCDVLCIAAGTVHFCPAQDRNRQNYCTCMHHFSCIFLIASEIVKWAQMMRSGRPKERLALSIRQQHRKPSKTEESQENASGTEEVHIFHHFQNTTICLEWTTQIQQKEEHAIQIQRVLVITRFP